MTHLKKIQYLLITVMLCLAALLSAGCAIYAMCFEWEVVSESRRYPKRPEFSIQPTDPPENDSLLDFSAIYYKYTPPMSYGERELGPSYNFMRFWPSGHVYKRVLNHIPTQNEAESFETAYMGFYHLTGTNLMIEMYVPNWGYIKSRGYVMGDAIHEYEIERRYGRRHKTYPKNYINIRYRIGDFSRHPDWSPTGMLFEVKSIPLSKP